MRDWNVVVSVHGEGFVRACQLLGRLGRVERTHFYNVLVMKVADRQQFLSELANLASVVPEILSVLSRVVPASETFEFDSVEAFEAKARDIALAWVPALANKSFHVRFHRRGFGAEMSSQLEERFLDEALLAALDEAGAPGRISFEDPDAIIDIETVDTRAGMSIWTREDRQSYPFLKLD